MILSGSEIAAAHDRGDIHIDPFERANINPNSYNYRLGDQLIELQRPELAPNEIVNLPQSGFVLRPGTLYLATTHERIRSERYVVTLLGRSSLGRLGLYLNSTADLGHIGSDSRWTLELSVVQPLTVYPRMRVGQIALWSVTGVSGPYQGRYLYDHLPTPNRDEALIAVCNGDES